MQRNQLIDSILLSEFVTHNLLYTDRLISCVYIPPQNRCTLCNPAFWHQVVTRDFLNHAHNCHCISQQQDTESHLHIFDIDINVSVDGLRDILAFCQFNSRNTPFLKFHINSYFFYVIYDVINILRGRVSLACNNKTIRVSNNTIFQFTQ